MRKLLVIQLLMLAFAVLALHLADSPPRAEAREPVDFERDIRPLLHARCTGCHGAEQQKSGLRLDRRDVAIRSGAIVPGNAMGSELIRRVTSRNAAEQMPPTGDRLTPRQVALLQSWIDGGANWPNEAATNLTPDKLRRADKDTWWSLQPLASTEPPLEAGIPAVWAHSPIDRFVYSGLAAKGLTPNPPADRRTLIRRLYYDLTGLPPSSEEVESFVSDSDPLAWEHLVDRLLASPHYGEHWGRHWLDVVRFGESKGFEQNHILNTLWPYRDYVIRSFNEDKPYDRFVMEQLAGDIVGAGHPEIEVATSFLVCGPYDSVGNKDEVQQKVIRANTLDDVITATSNAFLGLTVNCARCHHHKFDPIPTEDYYRLRAAFDGVTHGERVMATPVEKQLHSRIFDPLEKRRKKLTTQIQLLEKQISKRALDLADREGVWTMPKVTRHYNEHRFEPVMARQLRFRIRATSDRPKAGENARIDEFEVWTAGSSSRNIALAALGTRVSGSTMRRAEDVVGGGTYGVELVTDGRFGERWFVGSPSELTLTFPEPVLIERVVFSQDRTLEPWAEASHLGAYVTEYEIEVTSDGQTWHLVANSLGREPASDVQKAERFAARVTTRGEATRLARLRLARQSVEQKLSAIPPLPRHWAGMFAQPKESTYVHRGGDPMRRGGDVPPRSLAVLDGVLPGYELPLNAPEAERRVALARWITDSRNPLTSRVIVNRLWHYHFGTGIVDTPGDFGYLGGKPTHPELLDWLAERLKHHGWRLKPLQRELLLSQTWQQSSDHRVAAARIDGATRLLWRYPPRRLDAEEIRDTMLKVSGSLDLKLGGPGFRLYRYLEDNVATYVPLDRHGPETWRRAVYHQNARASLIDGLTDFDLPDNASPAPARVRTISPLQSLTQFNHRLTLDLAGEMVQRIGREVPGYETDSSAGIRRAFALAFQRQPTSREVAGATQLIAAHGWRAFTRALLNSNELIFLR